MHAQNYFPPKSHFWPILVAERFRAGAKRRVENFGPSRRGPAWAVLLASLPRDELTSPSRQVVERFVVRECRSHAAVAAAVLGLGVVFFAEYKI